jgi:hypothetical protein
LAVHGIGRYIALRPAGNGIDVVVNDIAVGNLESPIKHMQMEGSLSSVDRADIFGDQIRTIM